jgi:NAD(P)-dependent dehydrogenase (short-subunit alcohol dehydrogenase family)
METTYSLRRNAPPLQELAFSDCVVFGAAQGIGAAIASYLHDHGSRSVLLIDKSAGFGRDQATPGRGVVNAVQADVSSEEQLNKALSNCTPKTLDLAVLSAGIRATSIEDMRSVNVDGVKNSIVAVRPYLKKGALLILVSSDFFNVCPDDPYAVTKKEGALHALEVAKEHAEDFRVVILLPGPVRTHLFLHDKSQALVDAIDEEEGILSPQELSIMLFEQVIPQSLTKPSGSAVTMYKKRGVVWKDTGL